MVRTLAAIVLLSLFAAACSDDDESIPALTSTPTPSPTLSPTPPAAPAQVPDDMKSIDDLYADIAELVPGFGGSFYNPGDTSVLNVYLTDTTVDLAHVKQAILTTLNPNHFQIDPAVTIHPLQGRYDWRDLMRWYAFRYDLSASPSFTTTDIQESRNRLEFGMANEEDVAPVTQAFLDAGVPADAFRVSVVPPFEAYPGTR